MFSVQTTFLTDNSNFLYTGTPITNQNDEVFSYYTFSINNCYWCHGCIIQKFAGAGGVSINQKLGNFRDKLIKDQVKLLENIGSNQINC